MTLKRSQFDRRGSLQRNEALTTLSRARIYDLAGSGASVTREEGINDGLYRIPAASSLIPNIHEINNRAKGDVIKFDITFDGDAHDELSLKFLE